MSIRLLAKDLYRLQQEVEQIGRELSSAPFGQQAALQEKLRQARAERNRLRRLLDGQKDSRRDLPSPTRSMACLGHHPVITQGVAVVGSTTIDRNEIGDRRFIKLGGVTTYAGMTYRRHDLAVWAVTNISPADGPVLERLQAEGIRVLSSETRLTTRFINRLRDNRRLQSAPSVAPPVQYSQLEALTDQIDCVHLGPLHSADIAVEIFERLQGSSRLVILDIQGLVRDIQGCEVVPSVSEHLPSALKAARIVKAEESELEIILSSWGCGIEEIMARFDIAEWVVTAGPGGGRIYTADGRVHPYRSAPASTTIDPTGAGDVFFAAYTVARSKECRPIATACRYAAAVSAELVAGRYIPNALIDLSRFDPLPDVSGSNCIDNKLKER